MRYIGTAVRHSLRQRLPVPPRSPRSQPSLVSACLPVTFANDSVVGRTLPVPGGADADAAKVWCRHEERCARDPCSLNVSCIKSANFAGAGMCDASSLPVLLLSQIDRLGRYTSSASACVGGCIRSAIRRWMILQHCVPAVCGASGWRQPAQQHRARPGLPALVSGRQAQHAAAPAHHHSERQCA